MALVAMTTADVVDFVSARDPSRKVTKVPLDPEDLSKGYRDEVEIDDDATKFRVRALDVFLMSHIYDNASSLTGRQGVAEIGIHTRVNQTNIDAVRFGLVIIPDNFRDRRGEQVRLKTHEETVNGRKYPDVVDDEVMNRLGLTLIQEMADKIKEISEVTPAEEKK